MNITEILLTFGSAVIMAVLTYDIYRRYQQHQGTHTHLLFWGAGLGMFAVASLCGGLLYLGWSEAAFRGWFLFGVILDAAWIGQGTIVLLFRRRWATFLSMAFVVLSILAVVIFLGLPVNGTAYQPAESVLVQYKSVVDLKGPMLVILILFNTYGTIAIVGGALWSSWLFYRKEILPNRVLGNVLIAAAALAIAGAGTLTAAGYPQLQEASQLVAAILFYAGFVFASRPAAVAVSEPTPQVKPVAAK